jgi:hypothetical protein
MAPRCSPSGTSLQLAEQWALRRTGEDATVAASRVQRKRSSAAPEGLLARRLAMIELQLDVANTTSVTTSLTSSTLLTYPATFSSPRTYNQQQERSKAPGSSSSTLETSTLAAGGTAASTSLFSTPASTGTVAGSHAPTSAAAALAAAAASHNVSTSSASQTAATQAPVTGEYQRNIQFNFYFIIINVIQYCDAL